MLTETCRLCKETRDLEESHVLPAFAFRWIRKTAGGGFLRSVEQPNQRVQDGLKRKWLCRSCEENLGRSEKAFAERVFNPFNADSRKPIRYGSWLMHFCTSLSWRVANFCLEEGNTDNWGEDALRQISAASEAWRKVLIHEEPHARGHQQHLLPFDGIESTTMDLPPNANRYLLRAIQMDTCGWNESIFTYAKLGGFIFVGFVHEPNLSHWKGTKVNANRGFIQPRKYVLPGSFGNYLMDKAQQIDQALESISDGQAEKIEEWIRKNADTYRESDAFAATKADLEMFGSAALSKDRNKAN